MKIKFERSGGFSGIRNSCVVDSDNLSLDEQKYLQELLKDIQNNTENRILKTRGRDCFQYRIVIENKKKLTITADESTIDPKLRSLVDFLETRF